MTAQSDYPTRELVAGRQSPSRDYPKKEEAALFILEEENIDREAIKNRNERPIGLITYTAYMAHMPTWPHSYIYIS